eukprot:CAMPEP_0180268238 /NCGR_PEP_ID=MMETSP0988-20121125/1999_1 /TAXON_ID=697907 /ORGANISM="non described non described, Strain CCMP2293" /LENGTH=316 /DNA_ID=CAMNT_0022239017 /DNA_START=104 /DNA_END=1055 /DNA_ORIENTATION=+
MSASAKKAKCDRCGKGQGLEDGPELRKCAKCHLAWYCGKECQKLAWKGHKEQCFDPENLKTMRDVVSMANKLSRFQDVLNLEWLVETMMLAAAGDEQEPVQLMEEFGCAHMRAGNFLKAAGYFQRKAASWGKGLAQEHGFFQVDGHACFYTAEQDVREGRTQEGMELYRYVISLTPFFEDENKGKMLELWSLQRLVKLLMTLDGKFFIKQAKPGAAGPHWPEEPEELEGLFQKYEEAVEKNAAIVDEPEQKFLVHDLRASLYTKRGDFDAARREIDVMQKVARKYPRQVGGILDRAEFSTQWTYDLLLEMRAKHLI